MDLVEAEKAWDITKGSSDVIVAIVEAQNYSESGIPNKNHYDLAGKFASGGDDLEQGEGPGDHATNVAGIVGAATNNNAGIASLGWNIRMRPYRFDETDPDIGEDDQALAAAIYRALNAGCDVMNCSFGLTTGNAYNPCGSCWVDEFAEASDIQETTEMLDDAFAVGVIVVGSAGNDYSTWTSGNCSACLDDVYQNRFPAAYLGQNGSVIAVTATDQNDDPITGYNQGLFIDVAAPGISVKRTSGSTIGTRSGTSFSAPLVAALAGLIKSINPDITPSQVTTIVRQTAYDTGDPNVQVGYGRINAYEALKYTLENYGGTLSGEVTLTEDLTIQSGTTLTIAAGTQVKFDPGVILYLNGTLNIDGESGDEVTLTRSGASGTWDGIQINYGGSGAIERILINFLGKGNFIFDGRSSFLKCIL